MDITSVMEREKVPGTSAELLHDVLTVQENLIHAQQEAVMRLLHENMEQDAIIQELMRDRME